MSIAVADTMYSLATFLWRTFLPLSLASHLDGVLSAEEIEAVYGSTETASSYDKSTAASVGIVSCHDLFNLLY